jgi:hypothetical protein
MKTKRPTPTPADDARREIKQHLRHWTTMVRWFEMQRDLDSPDPDADSDLLVHCQGIIKSEVIDCVQRAAGARSNEGAVAVLDDVIVVVVPACEDDKPSDSHGITESDGFMLLHRDAMAVLEEDDAA